MTVRAKLTFSYIVMLVIVVAIAGASIWSILDWKKAASELSWTYARSMLAERLRASMSRQINSGREYISGDKSGRNDFFEADKITLRLIDELRVGSIGDDELDHIRGLQETHFELVWIANQIFAQGFDSSRIEQREISRTRLREISDEVSDDIATLNQYYRTLENRNIDGANKAGEYATVIIALAAGIAVVQLLTLILLLQRWLAHPITLISRATREISVGGFDHQISINTSDEWGDLAAAINKMSRALKQSQQRLLLQERLAALGEIASYTAHNLRNPLAGIRAAAQVGQCEPSATTEIRESLDEVIGAVDRMDNWIKRFLTYAKPLNLQIDLHDLNQIISEVASLAHRPYGNKADLRLNLDRSLPEAAIDGVLIEQAIHVIVTNAFESLENGGLVEIATRSHGVSDGDPWGKIIITDNGRGIPPQIRQKLFRPFTTSKEGGTGLGLAQAKKIIDTHGGEIIVESLEPGTRVIISLPLRNGSLNENTNLERA